MKIFLVIIEQRIKEEMKKRQRLIMSALLLFMVLLVGVIVLWPSDKSAPTPVDGAECITTSPQLVSISVSISVATCGELVVVNGATVPAGAVYGETVNITCNKGMAPAPTTTATCSNGTWPSVTCKRKIDVPYIEKMAPIKGGGFQFYVPERLVHLDLKGAPPRMEILEQFIPMVKRLGGTGLLIEYEDMLPYSGELKILQAYNAYSVENIKQIIELAEKSQLKVVPLVQTVGHLEYLLKWGQFGSLRALSTDCDSICVCKPKTKQVLKEMIRQMVRLHPNITMIHLGADEARNIKSCKSCSVKASSGTILQLEHIAELANFVKKELGVPRVLIWNDLTATANPTELNELKIGKLVEPVVWGYAADVTKPGYFPNGMLDRYSKVFQRVWFATAFKGATKPTSAKMSIQRPHLENHKSYLRLITAHWPQLEHRSPGFIITGWSRICHFFGLMELLPMGIPSLATMLQFLHDNGTVQETLFQDVASKLNCKADLAPSSCRTPEIDCFLNCSDFGNQYRHLYRQFESLLRKYGRGFQLRPHHIYPTNKGSKYRLPPYQDDVESMRKALYLELQRLTFDVDVNEWITNVFDSHYSRKES